jgi:hypothetical protein
MKTGNWPLTILMLFALALSFLPPALAAPAEEDGESTIVVYYFHGDKRCRTCRTIEAYTAEALESRFSEELESGSVEWRVVNYDEPANEHFLEDFGLYSSSVVIVEQEGNQVLRHEILPEVWSLVREKQSFLAYVNTAVKKHLE